MVFRSKYGAQIIMTPTYIMPPKPTCKVVKREGQRGARIDPKGCKVRTTKDTQGNKKKVTPVKGLMTGVTISPMRVVAR